MALSCSTNLIFIELFCWAPIFWLSSRIEQKWMALGHIILGIYSRITPNVAFSSWLGLSFELILSESELDFFFYKRNFDENNWMCGKGVNLLRKFRGGGVAGVLGARWFYDIFHFSSSMPPLSSTGSFLRKRTFGEGSFFGSRSLRPWSRRVR